MNYFLKLETLGFETTSVILTCSIVKFTFEEILSYNDLFDKALFVKFSVEDQVKTYKREISRETADWWKTTPTSVRDMNFVVKEHDRSVIDGLKMIRDYVKEPGNVFNLNGEVNVLNSLARKAGEKPFFYNDKIFCGRTFIACLREGERFDCPEYQRWNPISEVCNEVLNLVRV